MSKPKPCEYCGHPYHQPYEDGLVECRNNLFMQRDFSRDIGQHWAAEVEAETIARVVAWLREQERHSADQYADALARGDWKR